jgi:3-oxoacyl-[acyl-carrier protein] reductase
VPSERPIILTGAASGIGRAAAQALAAKSHTLALIDVNAQMLDEIVGICQKSSAKTRGFTCDVTDQAAVTQIWEQVRGEFGSVATLINCAGIGRFAPFLDMEPAEWLRMFNVNVMGAVHLTRAVLPDMLVAGEGLIINVSSRMAIDPHPTTTAYAASKAALHAFSKSLAMEVKNRGIKVTFLAPGGTKTNIATPKHEGYLEPSAIADAIVYIIENKAKNVWVRDLVVLPLGF